MKDIDKLGPVEVSRYLDKKVKTQAKEISNVKEDISALQLAMSELGGDTAKTYGSITLHDYEEGESQAEYIERSVLKYNFNSLWYGNRDTLDCPAILPDINDYPIGYELIASNNSGTRDIIIDLYPASHNQFESPANLPSNGTNSHNNQVTIPPQRMFKFIKGIRGIGWSVFEIPQLNSSHTDYNKETSESVP